jgi:hypothetical protein
MLALVRKAWGPDVEINVSINTRRNPHHLADCSCLYCGPANSLGVRVEILSDDDGHLIADVFRDTLGLALAAALLAAPAKAGEP